MQTLKVLVMSNANKMLTLINFCLFTHWKVVENTNLLADSSFRVTNLRQRIKYQVKLTEIYQFFKIELRENLT